MSLYLPYRFFDPSQIPQNVIWMGISWGIQYGLKKLFQRHPIRINRHEFWRKIQWCKIFSHALCFMGCGYIEKFWKFLGLRLVEKQFDKIMLFNIKQGFTIFQKLEPKAAEFIVTKLREWTTTHQ